MASLDDIKLTPELETMLHEMIEDAFSAETPIKQIVRLQKWVNKIYRKGVEDASVASGDVKVAAKIKKKLLPGN